MIHTGEFVIMLNLNNERDRDLIERINSIGGYSNGVFTIVIRITRLMNNQIVCVNVHVDFIKLLGKVDIGPSDAEEIEFKVQKTLESIMIGIDFELNLTRLDFRLDVLIEDNRERDLIIRLLQKSMVNVCYMKKSFKYKTTVKFRSKSRSNIIYDKSKERLENKKQIQRYEENILRFEAQLKNDHIKYNKRKYGVDRSIKSYLTTEKYHFYMRTMVISVVGKGDFYSLREAEKIINNANIKDKVKGELREFLIYTSTNMSLEQSREKYKRYKFEKYIRLLEDLNINPIIMPEKERVNYLENPLRNLIDELS